MTSTAAATYANRIDSATARRAAVHRQWSLLGNLRLVAALIVFLALWQALQPGGRPWLIVVAVALMAFLVLAFRQRTASHQRDALDAHILINERARDRLALRWDALPLPPDADTDRTHPYAYDLNVVGWGSVAQRLGTPATDHGWHALYAALLNDRDLADITARQAAVRELAGKLDLRQRIETVAVGQESVPNASALVDWSASRPQALPSWLRGLSIVGPLLVLVCVVLAALGIVPWVVAVLPITLNTLAFLAVGSSLAGSLQQIAPMREAITGYRHIIAEIAADDPDTALLRDLDTRLSGAANAMGGLGRIVNFIIPPGSMLYFPLQMLSLWDVHVQWRLTGWHHRHGPDVRGWLEAMGAWEALAALSVLSHDHPGWATPTITPAATGITARGLAHPLLADDLAVANDVEIGPAGHFLFVTGSNMSGKSTLLRAIGANVVLAQAGAVTCAASLTLPPLRISSCMRVEDSLAHGVSFFMAELTRLKAVVDRVQQPDDRMALYLLDEILQGTNTAERQIASRFVLQQLSTLPALGAVSSHDLELIAGTTLEDAAIAVHFAEQFHHTGNEPEMTFDYRLRPGLATSSNAIRLMEMIGFTIPD